MTTESLLSSVLAFTLCLLSSGPLHAGVYKWVDENGQVHYGEQPAGSGAERVTIRQNETTRPRQIKKGEADEDKQNAGDEAIKAEPEKPVKPKISRKEKRRLCSEARSDIASINSRGRMREISKKGEYVYLSEKQRQQRLSAAKKKQREYCR